MNTSFLSVAAMATALSLTPLLAEDWYAPAGTHSAADYADYLIDTNTVIFSTDSARLLFDGGTYTVDNIQLRFLAPATGGLYLSNGYLTATKTLSIGQATDSLGLVDVSGGTLEAAGYDDGSGTTVGGVIYVGQASGSQGILSISGGSVYAQALSVAAGQGSSGTLSIANGEAIVYKELTLGGGNTASAHLTVGENGYLDVGGLSVGGANTARVIATLSGGDTVVNGNITLSPGVNSSVSLYLNGGNLSAEHMITGRAQTTSALISQTAGAVSLGSLSMGWQSSQSSAYEISGGSLQTATLLRLGANGQNSTATLSVTGGEVTVGSTLVMGVAANTTNALSITGGSVQAYLLQTATTTSTTLYGENSHNTITIDGSGSLNILTGGQLGNVANSHTTISMAGNGSLSFATYLNTGSGSGSSTLISLAGNAQATVGGRINFGLSTFSNDLIQLTDNASLYVTSTIGLCQGSMLVSGNASVATPVQMYVGQADYDHSALTVSGGNVNVGTDLIVGRSGTTSGTISMTGGNITVGGTLIMGQGANAKSTIAISSGSITASALHVGIGNSSTNVLDISGDASLYISGTSTIGQQLYTDNTIRIRGGTLNLGGVFVGRTSTVTSLIEQTGGAFIVRNYLNMTYQNNSITTYSMSGGTFVAPGVNMAQQLNSKAIWALSGDAQATVSGNVYMSSNITSQATLSVGGDAQLTAGSIMLGAGINATGSYLQTGGTVSATNFNAAYGSKEVNKGNAAVINISGGELAVTSGMRLGMAGSIAGTIDVDYTQTGGNVSADWIAFGANSSSVSSMTVDATLSGGLLASNKHIDIGANNTDMGTNSANVTVSGTGALQAANGISVLRGGNLVANRVYVSAEKTAAAGEVGSWYFRTAMGGNATLGEIENTSGEVYLQGSSSMTVQNISVLGAELTQARLGVQSGTLTVANTLTLGSSASGTVANANAYVSADGTLRAARIDVLGGASLSVTGVVSMLSTNGITLDSGDNDGNATLALNAGAVFENAGDLVLNKNANLRANLSDAYAAPTVGKSLVFSTAAGDLGTQLLTLDFTNLTDPLGDTVLLLVTDTIAGFDAWYANKDTNVVVIGLADGYTLESLSLGNGGKSLIASVAIPEPAAAAALLGLLGLALVARRRR